MPSYSLVIFDCDGVLVDSERLSHLVLQEMIREYGKALTLQQTLDHFMGTSTEKTLSILASLIDRPVPPDFMELFRDREFHAFETSLTAVDGAPELVSRLRVEYCVASNGTKEKMRCSLGCTGLLARFNDRMFSADDVSRPKPAPDLFLHAAKSFGSPAKDCIVVEDSPTGVLAAKSAGMAVIGYAAMGQRQKLLAAGADAVYESMGEISSLLV